MGEVVKAMLEHPIASIFVIVAIGHAIALCVHGESIKPVVLVSKPESKTAA